MTKTENISQPNSQKPYVVEIKCGSALEFAPQPRQASLSIDEKLAQDLWEISNLLSNQDRDLMESITSSHFQIIEWSDWINSGEEELDVMECDRLVVYRGSFKITGLVKHTDILVENEGNISLQPIFRHFGLTELNSQSHTKTFRPTLCPRELAAILVGLRAWQEIADFANPVFQDIASSSGDFNPLSKAEIDLLCERLNCG
jgi:hypothetical protein